MTNGKHFHKTLLVNGEDRGPSVRRAFVVAVRTPRAAFLDPFLTPAAANRRARIATNRGWSARVVAVDLVTVDGSSLDPLDLDDPVETVAPPRPRRGSRRSAHARLDRAEATAAAGVVVELDGDEDLVDLVDLADHDGGRSS